MENKNDFEFNYVAPTANERKEIESIRNSYMPKNKGAEKLERLRTLDAKVRNIPTTISLILGIAGMLIFGLGLTMILEWNIIIWGCVVGVVGLVPTALSYFIYIKLSSYLKNKYSNEILSLSAELLRSE